MDADNTLNFKPADIALLFSNGEFEKTFDYIAENAQWIVVEENVFEGKEAILHNCRQVSAYFNSVTTDFNTLTVITDGLRVAINGTAAFYRDQKRVAFVSACDVYEFNEEGKMQKITSYCISSKETL